MGFRKYTKYTHVQHNDKIQGRIELNSLTECGLWTPQTTFVLSNTAQWKYWVTWADIPIYIRSTKPHRGQIFYSNLAQISTWKDIKKYFQLIYFSLSHSCLTDISTYPFFVPSDPEWTAENRENIFYYGAQTSQNKKHQKYFYPISGLALTISMLNYTTAHNCHHH